jgi:hypothetical protein
VGEKGLIGTKEDEGGYKQCNVTRGRRHRDRSKRDLYLPCRASGAGDMIMGGTHHRLAMLGGSTWQDHLVVLGRLGWSNELVLGKNSHVLFLEIF